MNPWEQKVLERCRSVLRFGLWVTIVANGLMVAAFSMAFLFQFLWHLWGYCRRVLFSQPW